MTNPYYNNAYDQDDGETIDVADFAPEFSAIGAGFDQIHAKIQSVISGIPAMVAASLASANEFDNGLFRYWQRGSSFSSPASGQYLADRWFWSTSTDDAVTITQETHPAGDNGVPFGARRFMRIAVTAGTTGTVNRFTQYIENVNLAAGKARKITVYAKPSVAMTITVVGAQIFGSGGSAAAVFSCGSLVFDEVGVMQRRECTFNIPSTDGKTHVDNEHYTQYQFRIPVNQTYTLDVGGLYMAPPEIEVAYMHEHPAITLKRCQRFFRRGTVQRPTFDLLLDGMRVAPTETLASGIYSYDSEF